MTNFMKSTLQTTSHYGNGQLISIFLEILQESCLWVHYADNISTRLLFDKSLFFMQLVVYSNEGSIW